MAVLGITNYCNRIINTPTECDVFLPFATQWANPALGAGVIMQKFGGQSATPTTLDFTTPATGELYPVDLIALLGTTMTRGDSIGIRVQSGLTILLDEPIAPIVTDWPFGKRRNFVWRLPRQANGLPHWVDLIRLQVRFGGERILGQGYFGPGIVYQPNTILEYGYDDRPARVDRTISGIAFPVEYETRRSISLGTRNLRQDVALELDQYIPPGGGRGLKRSLQSVLSDEIGRGTRVLVAPVEQGAHVSHFAEYGRISRDPTFQQGAGRLLGFTVAFEED